MFEFHVSDMTCGHCSSTITNAIKQAAPGASVQINLDDHLVRVDGATDAAAIMQVISQAGYTPVVPKEDK